MKISKSWLKQLVDLNCSFEELIKLLALRSVSTKEVTEDFIELDMKGYNRADLLSMRGVALEVAAITDSKVKFADETNFVWQEQNLPGVEINGHIVGNYPTYCVAKIEGLKVEPSNKEWIKKLADSGMRSVNNITDVTNLVMLEYGQPLHAFDASNIKGIHVDKALPEKFVTLDGKERLLEEEDLVIKSNHVIGIAGIMGGKNSEVTDKTNSILLEAAIFDPIPIRKTATRLGLQSEASKRFEHGLTKKRLLQTLDAAIKKYQEIGGKLTAITLIGSFEEQPKVINLSNDKVRSLIGVDIKDEEIKQYLQKLYFTVKEAENGWEVTVPYWRLDVNIEEDVIEEVARMYGYEKIPAEAVSESKPLQKEDPIFKKISDLREALVKAGLIEVQTYSFYSTQIIEALEIKKESMVKIANPISSETEYLRQNLWPNLMEVVGRNLRKGFKDIAIFEIGKAFNVGTDGNPVEDYRLSIALMNESNNPIAELSSIVESLNITGTTKLFENHALFHPKRQIGNLAEVHLRVLNQLGIEKRLAVLEIEIN